ERAEGRGTVLAGVRGVRLRQAVGARRGGPSTLDSVSRDVGSVPVLPTRPPGGRQMDVIARVDEIVARLKAASWKEREAVKDELLAAGREADPAVVVPYLEDLRRGLPLEVRWEVEEVIEALR